MAFAGADLQHVRLAGLQFDAGRVDDLGDHRKPGLLPDVGEQAQAGFAETLVGVGRGAGLERPGAQRRGPRFLGHPRGRRVWDGVSAAHGPAITVRVTGPIGTPATLITDRSGWCSRLTGLYGAEIRTTSSTLRRLDRLRASNASTSPTSPTSPTMVRLTPRLTNASPPAARTNWTISSTSS